MPVHRPSPRRSAGVAALAAATAAALLVAPSAAADPDPGALPPSAETGWVTSTLARMSLEQKLGQLFVTHAYGSDAQTVTAAEAAANQQLYGVSTPAEVVRKYHLGGVIYFAWTNSVKDPAQIARLSNGLQDAALSGPARVRVPLMVSTDQEQGVVTRVGAPATLLPGSMALGAGRSEVDAHDAAEITGRELRALGVNQDFAPVADVNVNPANPVIGVRSFSSDADLVSTMVTQQVRGYESPGSEGVSATAKHFPGHGDTATDSHYGLPVITHTREEWEQVDAPPFRAAIAEGVDSIMTAHIVVPNLDASGDPATLSKPILTGILRDELGYDGVVVTDSLAMQGVRDKYGDDEVAVRALLAGADQLLMPPQMDLAWNAVRTAVDSGRIPMQRVDESVERVLRMKWQRGVVADPYVEESAALSSVGTPAHLARAQEITDRTVTMLRDAAGTPGAVPAAVSGKRVLVAGDSTTTPRLAAALERRGATVTQMATGTNPSPASQDAVAAATRTHDLSVVLTNRARSSSAQKSLLQKVDAAGAPVIVTAVRDPYDAAYAGTRSAFLATYSTTAVSMESLAKVITGEQGPKGRLPVSIPAADGSELFAFGAGIVR